MKHLISVCAIFFSISVYAQQVELPQAIHAATWKAGGSGLKNAYAISGQQLFPDGQGSILFYLFTFEPTGYVVVSGRYELPPVIAYSFDNGAGPGNLLTGLVTRDLGSRLQYQPASSAARNRSAWQSLLENREKATLFQQWPEPGTTATGGWLESNWTQNSPYNDLCPMDPVTDNRSIAGCPAVAMAMIVNFHQTINKVHFDDADDYYHSYAGRNYMIDDDYATVDFPSFPTLNAYLDTCQMNYYACLPPTDRDMAALTFACGVAATQVYTSTASGTFGVDQAFQAYQKFNFDECELLMGTDTTVNARMAQNIKDTLPVHLAVVDPGWTMGHNVVVDGYNTDEYFHLNFGWGGAYNGWYLIPEEIPYGLTVIEGAVVDIVPIDVTSIGEQPAKAVLFYPNPANDQVRMNPGITGSAVAVIHSADGRLLRTLRLDNTENIISVSDLPEGIYFVGVSGNEGYYWGKILVSRD